MRLLVAIAAAKVAIGLALFAAVIGLPPLPPPALPSWYYVALLLIFGVSGVLLHAGGRHDVRARLLGTSFLLFGTLFTDRMLARAPSPLPWGLDVPLAALARVHLTAFLPYVLWRFVWEFPRVQPLVVSPRLASLSTGATLAAAVVLVLANALIPAVAPPQSTLAAVGTWLSPDTSNGLFWPILALLELPPLALLIVKLRAATIDERRRLTWVVAGIAIGTMPMIVHVLLFTIVPAYATFADEPLTRRALGIGLTAISLVGPASAAYAVLVERVFDVRFLMRRALQYALARYTVLGLMGSLAAVAAWIAYGNRARPLGDLLGQSPWPVVVLLLLAAVLLWRRPLLDRIDRRFFREHYDARRILVDLVDRSQRAQTARDIMALITLEVDRALHLERIALLVRDDDHAIFRQPDGIVRELDVGGALGSLIAGLRLPLDVDLSSESSPLGRLPERDREWLMDAGARLIVPLFGAQGTPIGVLALGDKRSELPFTQEDRRLMAAVAASAALALEQKMNSESPNPDAAQPTPKTHALQCVVCGRVQARHNDTCGACGGRVQDALLPAVLAGKFEVERQIGAGGMGVVYRARDLSLTRLVALKVLPRLGPHAAARLRREARAMAVLQHPNLAVIHAMETWRGAPALVLEYLAGGTLADRIRHGPIPVTDLLTTGTIIATVLRHVHRAGFLHRDIKPSNIGFTGGDAPKLLDFGLVRLMAELAVQSTAGRSTSVLAEPTVQVVDSTGSHPTSDSTVQHFVGTPAYMSPEALMMAPATPNVDLWGLSVTLFEGLTGKNPFSAHTAAETVRLINRAIVPDPRVVRPDCPPALATFLALSLSADLKRRPQNATEFIDRLSAVAADRRPDA